MAVLITGCSSGIGLDAALFLRDNGYDVIATARNDKDIHYLKQNKLKPLKLELGCDESISNGFNEALLLADNGRIDVLINNAAFAQVGALEDLCRTSLRKQFETNVFGVQLLTNLAVKSMRVHNQGKIIHIGSILGVVSMPFTGAYNASKYALEGLADTLRLELNDTDISVTVIEPGPIESSFRANCLKHSLPFLESKESRFQNAYDKQKKQIQGQQSSKFMKPSRVVSKKLLKIMRTRKPKPRYRITTPAHIVYFLKRILPSRSLDFILKRASL